MSSSATVFLGLAALGAASAIATARPQYVGPGGVIPDLGSLSSTITVSPGFVVGSVSIDLFNLQHTWAGDLRIRLTHGAMTVDLVDRVGYNGGGFGSSAQYGGDYTFRDGAANLWVAAAMAGGGVPIPVGAYAPSSSLNGPSMLSAFAGADAGGEWLLTIEDLEKEDEGSLGQMFPPTTGVFQFGWRLNIEPVPTPGAACLLAGAPAVSGAPRRR